MPDAWDVLPKERTAAIAWYADRLAAAQKKGADAVWAAERWLAQNDLFFLLIYVMKRRDINRDWLFNRCREVQREPNGYLDLWFREGYKSTIITVALTIQNILNHSDLTVGIFSHTRPVAKSFLRQIKREFEANEDLKRLFPDILFADPHHQSPKWSEDDGIIVNRKGNPKEATVEAWGLVDGQPTGKHFMLLVYDDVVTTASVTTPEMIQKTTEAWAMSLNLGAEGGARRTIGTRYHFADTYYEMLERGAVKPRIYPATDDGTFDGEPVLWSRETLAAKRRDMGPWVAASQLLQNPTADQAQGFKREWLQYWEPRHVQGLNLYIVVDPASSKKAKADYTVMMVVGLGEDDVYRIVDMIRDRLNLTERADRLFAWHRQYRPLGVGYEAYGLMSDIEHFKDRMKRENYRFHITEVAGKMKKEERIRRLIPLFEQGRVLLPESCWHKNAEGTNEDLTRVFVNQEFLPFPVSHHDDMLDALARIVDLRTDRPQRREAQGGPTQTQTAMRRLRR